MAGRMGTGRWEPTALFALFVVELRLDRVTDFLLL